MKDFFESPLLAIGALALSAVIGLAKQPAEGMMGTVGQDKPIGSELTGDRSIGMTGCKETGNLFVIASNVFQQTDHGALEGYFAVGKGFDGMLRPVDPRFHWLREFRDKPVDVIIRVREPKVLERIR